MANEIANEIVSRLWLGNKQAAADEDWLRKHNITVVFNCTKTLPFAENIPRMYRVPVDDNLEPEEIANMAAWAAETQVKLLREYKAGRTILVHCHAGMQRSAAVVAMFLITTTGMSADEAIAFVKSKRPIAFFPSANFEKSIRYWDAEMRKYRGPQQNASQTNAQKPAIAVSTA
jgi:atypical dual specificity phosphatase